MKVRTWQIEIAIVAAILVVVAIATGGSVIELLGATAVTLSFAHAQVADRLAERDAARETPSVACHRWATRYLVSKEAVWCAYFIAHRSWSALAGVALFLAYSPWRQWWRRRHPLHDFAPIVVEKHHRVFTRTPHRQRVVMPRIDPEK